LTSIIEKRLSLHKSMTNLQQENDALKSQIAQLQTLANIGTISFMIAHEINNLLTPLKSYASLALGNSEDKALSEKALQKAVQNCQRASEIMASMLALANGKMDEKKNARLVTLIEEVFACLCRDFRKDGITVNIQVPEDLTVQGVSVQIQQVLMNLILNARDAMLPAPASPDARRGGGPRGGVLTIKAQENTDAVEIEVADTGKGIESENLRNIFEPFFTTKAGKNLLSERSGAGLGLAFCKKIIEAHKGRISVESMVGKGSIFKITLPKSQPGV
jgi:signal transduction histidine kinase